MACFVVADVFIDWQLCDALKCGRLQTGQQQLKMIPLGRSTRTATSHAMQSATWRKVVLFWPSAKWSCRQSGIVRANLLISNSIRFRAATKLQTKEQHMAKGQKD